MDSDTTNGSGFGFLRSFRARKAEDAIQHSEGLVTVLRLSQTDLKAAEDALTIAKGLFRSRQFGKALTAARKAEAIAITLDDRFNGYQKAVKTLRIRIDDLARLGLRTERLEAILGHAEEKVLAGAWESGAFVPNYLEARAVLDQAAEQGRRLLVEANAASNRIFLAELAIEALGDMKGLANPKAFAGRTVPELERALEEATRELALGNVEAASRIAGDLEARAEKIRIDYGEAIKVLDLTESRMAELRGEGIVAGRLEEQAAFARDMLSKGMVAPGFEMARRLAEEAVALGEAHRRAAMGLADAEVLYQRLVVEGFHSYEADAALKDARRAVKEGSYPRALEHLDKAQKAFARRRNAREALAKALEQTRTRVTALQSATFPLLPDVQEVLGRAEREFRQGNYSGSSEDLQIATVLLSQTRRSSTMKG